MTRNTNEGQSNPLSRVFSKIFHHDAGDAKAPPAAPHPAPPAAAPHAPTGVQAAAHRPAPVTPQAHAPTPAAPSPGAATSSIAPGAAQVGMAASTPVATPTSTQRTHTVAAGESLSKIAQHVYGRADQWRLIFDANRDRIHDPDLIHPGQVLVIPDAPTTH